MDTLHDHTVVVQEASGGSRSSGLIVHMLGFDDIPVNAAMWF